MTQAWTACRSCARFYAAPCKELSRGRWQHCSVRCAADSAIRTGKFRGDKNPRWAGGVSTDNMRYRRRQIERHPVEEAARRLVHNAVKRGELVRLPCEHCGAAKTAGHHADYSKPLTVVWLCRPCHDAEHARLRGAV